MEDLKLMVRKQGDNKEWVEITVNHSKTTKEVKDLINAMMAIPPESQKLLCMGKWLKDEQTLQAQGVKTGSKVLISITNYATKEQQQQLKAEVAEVNKINKLAEAAEHLAKRNADSFDDQPRFELMDQNGRPVNISNTDAEGLTVGMALQEKGKAMVRQGKFKEALEILTEADKAFSRCSNTILQSIDNYGLLCIDICWAYFKLKDLSVLKDAEWRLTKARECLERAHGKKLERVVAIKGVAGMELVLYIRLDLLEGIAAFYNNRYTTAREKFANAEQKMQLLRINTDDMTSLMSMGFSEKESRLGLRGTGGNVERATTLILKQREERIQREEEDRKRRNEERERRKYGKTAAGLWVDVQLVKNIVGMGFEKGLVAEALRQTDNNQEMALNLLTTSPELLTVKENKKRKTSTDYTEQVQALVAMGFTPSIALGTIRETNGDLDKAIENCLSGKGVEAIEEKPAENTPLDPQQQEILNQPLIPENFLPVGNNSPPSEKADEMQIDPLKKEKEEEMQQAEDELIKDFDNNEDAYLDVSLEEEESTLLEFNSLLSAML